MRTELAQAVFPVILFGRPDASMRLFRSQAELERAHFNSIKHLNKMEELFIVDSAGVKYVLGEAAIAEQPTIVKRLAFILTAPDVRIKYHRVARTGQVSVDELRARILVDLTEYADLWEEKVDYDEFERDVRTRSTVVELIQLFDRVQ